jgi:predicted acyl esterase
VHRPFRDEISDGYDSVEWAAAQPWSNGKVGIFGGSYVGYTQLAAAHAQAPSLKAIVPFITFCDPKDIFYYGGAFCLGVCVSWGFLSGALMEIQRSKKGLKDNPFVDTRVEMMDGIVCARYRKGDDEAHPVIPHAIEEYSIEREAASNVFKAGHRIRLEVSSSNFPRFDRNPNTGDRIGATVRLIPAVQTVFHDGDHPSRIVLPVIPR